MVNETKVKLMTKAAMVQKKDKRGMFTASRFFGDDYVSFQVIKGLIGVTLCYVLILALWVLENADALMTQYSLASLIRMAQGFGVLYILIVVITTFIGVLAYTSRYWKSRQSTKEYQTSLKKLSRIYQREEKERKE